ncbi:Lar family restriction alleviation protein [Martelella lutilitoris]|uniref:Lar family restriction alleviation protein n=1 Tax=Martelella lutilitoris TaxID=2583532 RepID=A0A7T7HHL0_9HYPH|nr:Lar family restriction alleviation protein [Martelella lutilitoris]QQM29334.1 Lar family restriction alleviation protein [Martelella lutilitoris]
MSTIELRPCPFCGGYARVLRCAPGCSFVQCTKCKASSDDSNCVEAWNTRAPQTIERQVKVKPLVWVDLHGDGSIYETSNDHPLGYHATVQCRGRLGWSYNGEFFKMVSGAMIAAQADYEKSILSAIEPADTGTTRETARHLDEWHEDLGFVTWWKFPVNEPAWIGTPNCSDWPGYHTHFTPHPPVPSEPGQ